VSCQCHKMPAGMRCRECQLRTELATVTAERDELSDVSIGLRITTKSFESERGAERLAYAETRKALEREKDRRVEVRRSNQDLNEVVHAVQKDLEAVNGDRCRIQNELNRTAEKLFNEERAHAETRKALEGLQLRFGRDALVCTATCKDNIKLRAELAETLAELERRTAWFNEQMRTKT
jgi:predicted  nucleic acid-binding Zn-ribbon protein